MSTTDVIVVSHNNRERLRACVEPLSKLAGVRVIVVDNASIDHSVKTIEDLAVEIVPLERNLGFSAACNVGWRGGTAPTVLFLNPDARLESSGIDRLVALLARRPDVGAVGPRIVNERGVLELSQRRFPRLVSSFAQAVFLHRAFPNARWSDEVIRDRSSYSRLNSPDWLSGACLLVRRSALEATGGWDEDFFLYSEDADFCHRLRSAGYSVLFEPNAVVTHAGGGSAPRTTLLPLLAWSRVVYARKHSTRVSGALQRVAIAIGCALRVAASSDRSRRRGQARAAWHVTTGRPALPPES